MASLLSLAVWWVMFLESLEAPAETTPATTPATTARPGLRGQMFSVNAGGSVTLRSDDLVSLSSFTVCLCHISELTETQNFFQLNLGGFNSISLSGTVEKFTLKLGNQYSQYSQYFSTAFPSFYYQKWPWTTMCVTWESGGGMAQLWRNGRTSVRKGLFQGQVLIGKPLLTISGFTGQVTDLHVWDYVLSRGEIASFSGGSVAREGTVLSWYSAQYSSSGYVVLEGLQIFSAALPSAQRLPESLAQEKADLKMRRKTRRRNSKRGQVLMGKGADGPIVLLLQRAYL
ncbi:hypothetical protein AGOR_G00075550 [Albula goreensis]|uniref:Pentraxin (PTX) domain-containing protein n=1 Tax=Albula goreensis TaxID=1534307 RepID=A0A8T3DS56_9TELE|nr:hypothetical protein AGOR_G00075550 [Albula goreensis]